MLSELTGTSFNISSRSSCAQTLSSESAKGKLEWFFLPVRSVHKHPRSPIVSVSKRELSHNKTSAPK